MEPLDNPIREYAWGSRTVLAEFLGRPPSSRPQAELWIGAHPSAASRLGSGRSLADHIAADPVAALGPAALEAFGPRLPFLLKVLAVEAPLSMQVHPDREQAERGFAAELAEGAGGALSEGGERNYKDDWPKPEILCALNDFHALCGWRDPGASAHLLDRVPALRPVAAVLRCGDLATAVRRLLTWPDPGPVVKEAAALLGEPYRSLAERYPDDVGVLVALLLNEVRLAPGQALYVPPRVPHAYLSGVGVELMASSDNVLRAGLTPKRVDVPELLKVVSFRPGPPHIVQARADGQGETFPTPAPEFRLSRLTVRGEATHTVSGRGPRLLLCTEGRVRLRRADDVADLSRGQAVFAPDEGPPLTVSGAGTVFQADLPHEHG